MFNLDKANKLYFNLENRIKSIKDNTTTLGPSILASMYCTTRDFISTILKLSNKVEIDLFCNMLDKYNEFVIRHNYNDLIDSIFAVTTLEECVIEALNTYLLKDKALIDYELAEYKVNSLIKYINTTDMSILLTDANDNDNAILCYLRILLIIHFDKLNNNLLNVYKVLFTYDSMFKETNTIDMLIKYNIMSINDIVECVFKILDLTETYSKTYTIALYIKYLIYISDDRLKKLYDVLPLNNTAKKSISFLRSCDYDYTMYSITDFVTNKFELYFNMANKINYDPVNEIFYNYFIEMIIAIFSTVYSKPIKGVYNILYNLIELYCNIVLVCTQKYDKYYILSTLLYANRINPNAINEYTNRNNPYLTAEEVANILQIIIDTFEDKQVISNIILGYYDYEKIKAKDEPAKFDTKYTLKRQNILGNPTKNVLEYVIVNNENKYIGLKADMYISEKINDGI